ncbi:MAG: hypothetical protein NW237_04405 [Cyanobacteriota bacterium]|nr:hypothetical protein [Cyanobacteriota bacterium]
MISSTLKSLVLSGVVAVAVVGAGMAEAAPLVRANVAGYNPTTGNAGRVAAGYNPTTGNRYMRASGYNASTGTFGRTAAGYNPSTGQGYRLNSQYVPGNGVTTNVNTVNNGSYSCYSSLNTGVNCSQSF